MSASIDNTAIRPMTFLLVALVFAGLIIICCTPATQATDEHHDSSSRAAAADESLQRWQQCDIFLAPSGWNYGGFGVFAARDFVKDEIVELAPLVIPMDLEIPVVRNSALRDYVYGYLRVDDSHESKDIQEEQIQRLAAVSMGHTMWFNHHPKEPNVAWGNFGLEPSESHPAAAQSVGLKARRDIQAGEELFSSYGDEDGGMTWFQERGLPLMDIPQEGLRMDETDLLPMSHRFCSKVYAGIGQPTWKDRIEPVHRSADHDFRPSLDTGRLAPFDAGVHSAVAKVSVKSGDILETAPALVLDKDKVDGTALAPLVFTWNDLSPDFRQSIKQFRGTKELTMQYQGEDNGWQRIDQWKGFDHVTIFPAAGSIALVQRVGIGGDPNCRVELLSSGMEDGNAGIVLQLLATKSIQAGELLKLDLPPSSASSDEWSLLETELRRTGQPISFPFSHSHDQDSVTPRDREIPLKHEL